MTPLTKIQLYLVWHGRDVGERESGSVFHETPEIYLNAKAAKAREVQLEAEMDESAGDWVHCYTQTTKD